jgi:hypothetical protein
MQAMAEFFDAINRWLGVTGPADLAFHPVFIGIAVIAFVYAVYTRMKYIAVAIAAIMGGAILIYYLYPQDTSNLGELVQFLAGMIGLGFLIAYVSFIRD